MSEHLPECADAMISDLHNERWVCICAALRACEQRGRMEDDDYAYVSAQAEADGRRRGWSEALDAAQNAVWALKDDGSDRSMSGKKQPDEDYYWAIDDAAAAIDALQTKP